MPTFGSLFAGIGGIDLGLERAGWECRWQVEWDGFCSTDLARHWPDVVRRGDITAVDFREMECVDLIAGGFPCQPVSVAGKQRGRDDERWLWPEFARAIRDVGPSYVLVENVRNLLAIDDGGPFGEVLGTLAALGYDAEWDCLPASAFGAPHQRDRLFLLAYSDREHLRVEPVGLGGSGGAPEPRGSGPALADTERLGPAGIADAARGHVGNRHDTGWPKEAGRAGERSRDVADADRERRGRRWAASVEADGSRTPAPGSGDATVADDDGDRREGFGRGGLSGDRDAPFRHDPDGRGEAMAHAHHGDAQGLVSGRDGPAVGEVAGERPAGLRGGGRRKFGSPQSRVVRAPDGLPSWMDGHRWPAPPGPQFEWEPPRTVQGRVPNRAQRIKALGNAVVPQVAEAIGRRLLEVMEQAA